MTKVLPLLLLICTISCNKKKDTTAELLANRWKMTSWTVLTPLDGTALEGMSTNWLGSSPCIEGRLQIFQPGGVFIHQKATACTADTDFTGTWTLSNNDKTINVNYTGDGYSNFQYNIIEITPAKLKVQRIERTGVGGSETLDLLMEYEFQPE